MIEHFEARVRKEASANARGRVMDCQEPVPRRLSRRSGSTTASCRRGALRPARVVRLVALQNGNAGGRGAISLAPLLRVAPRADATKLRVRQPRSILPTPNRHIARGCL